MRAVCALSLQGVQGAGKGHNEHEGYWHNSLTLDYCFGIAARVYYICHNRRLSTTSGGQRPHQRLLQYRC